jgi:hypothetical protein
MPEAWLTAIISAGRQVLWEFTAAGSKAALSLRVLPIPSRTREPWRLRTAHRAVDILVECIEHGLELHLRHLGEHPDVFDVDTLG